MPDTPITDTILEAVEGDASRFIVTVPVEKYFRHLEHILEDLTAEGFDGVYVSYQRPYKDLQHRFEHNDVDIGSLHIIDASTPAVQDVDEADSEHCTYIPPETDIEDLGRAIIEALGTLPEGRRFVLIDSITALALYQPPSDARELAAYLEDELDLGPNTTLLINVPEPEQDEDMVKAIEQTTDRVIHHRDQ